MEPVVFPKHVTPVTRADRVKRAKPRDDRNGGSFGKHLHRETEEQAEGEADAKEGREPVAADVPGVPEPLVPTRVTRSGRFGLDETVKKAIDIRV